MSILAAGRARFQTLSPFTVDSIIAVAVFGLSVASLLLGQPMDHLGAAPTTAFAYVLIAILTLPVAFRRRNPLAVFLVVLAAMTVYATLNYGGVNVDFFGPILAMYSVIVYGPRRFANWTPALVLVSVLGTGVLHVPPGTTFGSALTEIVNVVVVVGLVWFVSDTVRTRREQAEELSLRNRELEQARHELAHQAVADERLRIARELHDVVAHSMSIIAVQSGAGRVVIGTQPEEAAKALANIEQTSRAALHEMRRILSVLRSDDETEGSLVPAPTLLEIDGLIASTESAGIPVTVEVKGERGMVPAGVDLSAYRIVQEALTNVIKHAGPAHAQVSIDYGPGAVCVEVLDDGRGAAALVPDRTDHLAHRGSGNGLTGMRERASVYGGEVEAAPRSGGGFRVRARLPYDRVRA